MRFSRSQYETVAILVAPLCMAECFGTSGGHYKHPASTLLALAQTCRGMSDTALQEIWRELPSCAVFVHTLPLDLWKASSPDTTDQDHNGQDEDDNDDDDGNPKQYYVSTALSSLRATG